MSDGPPSGRPPPAKPDAYVTAYGRLALACSALALAGLVAFIPGWYFLICGYLAHGPFGSWRVGCTALVLLIAATMFSCLQV